ncbi:MAG TPA: hypothetical protein VGH90_07005 [Chthoniobacteraceae bacterium]
MRPSPCLVFVCALGLLNSFVRAGSKDASDKFLEVYEDCVVAEDLERSGDHATALLFYNEGSRILDRLAAESPNWLPSVVAFQKKEIADAGYSCLLAELRALAGQTPPATKGALGKAAENGAPDEKTSKRLQAQRDKAVQKMLREAKAKYEADEPERPIGPIGPWTRNLGMPGPNKH